MHVGGEREREVEGERGRGREVEGEKERGGEGERERGRVSFNAFLIAS